MGATDGTDPDRRNGRGAVADAAAVAADVKPATVEELMRVTRMGREAVKAAIRYGALPGYVVEGDGLRNRYVIPRAAFEAFCRGDWQPAPRPVTPITVTAPLQLLRRKGA